MLEKQKSNTKVSELPMLQGEGDLSSTNSLESSSVVFELYPLEAESSGDSDILKDKRIQIQNGATLIYSHQEEKTLLRKFDLHILSFLCIVFMLSHMDRTNIGNAFQAGMGKELNIDNSQYQLILNFFYIGYICFQWCILLWKTWKPSVFVPIVIISWGITSCSQGAVQNWKLLILTRFLLGALEAAFSPGIYYYFSFFYHRHEMAKRIGIFQSFSPISSSFTGAIAFAVTKRAKSHVHSLNPWRLLFIIEGVPSIFFGFLAFYCIYNGPYSCRFLTSREKDIAKSRTFKQVGTVDRGGSSISIGQIIETFKDPKIWFNTLLYFCMNVASIPIPIFLPTILAGIGFTDITAQGMSAPPYLVAVIAILFTCYISDKYLQRAYAIATCCAIAIIGYIILAVCKSEGVRYFGLFLAVPGVYACHAIIMTWTGDNQGSDSKRGAGYVILHVFGLTGTILGTRLFPKSSGPRYDKGIWITVGFISLTLVTSLFYRWYLAKMNQKLDSKHGKLELLLKERALGRSESPKISKNRCMNENSPLYRYIF